MRFKKDHDPDPMRSKYQSFHGIANLPEEVAEKVSKAYAKIASAAAEYEEVFPEQHGLVAYMAVQDVQITALQQEIRNILNTLVNIATKLDEHFDNQ